MMTALATALCAIPSHGAPSTQPESLSSRGGAVIAVADAAQVEIVCISVELEQPRRSFIAWSFTRPHGRHRTYSSFESNRILEAAYKIGEFERSWTLTEAESGGFPPITREWSFEAEEQGILRVAWAGQNDNTTCSVTVDGDQVDVGDIAWARIVEATEFREGVAVTAALATAGAAQTETLESDGYLFVFMPARGITRVVRPDGEESVQVADVFAAAEPSVGAWSFDVLAQAETLRTWLWVIQMEDT